MKHDVSRSFIGATLLVVVVLLTPPSVSTQATKDQIIVTKADVPSYPPVAAAAGLTGTIVFVTTLKDGVAVKTEVESGNQTHQGLIKAASDNLKTWRFERGQSAVFKTTFVFELAQEETEIRENPRVELQLPSFVRLTMKRAKPGCLDCGATTRPRPVD